MEATEDPSGRAPDNRTYYDAFARHYDDRRARGYHKLIDDQAAELVRRVGMGKEVLEVGCGTGLILERIARFASRAEGVDLSPGMAEHARRRGLNVQVADATTLPYADGSFDVACSFKVLAHVPDIGKALSEMARVTRPGGVILAEFYNPWSFRGLAKKMYAGKISDATKESAVYTRFDSPATLPKILPPGTTLETARGIRIVTPAAAVMRVPGLRGVLTKAERLLCDSPAARFGGFYVAVIRKG